MKKIFTLMAVMLLVPWVGWGQETITINTAKDLRDFAEKVNGNTDEDASWDVVLGANINLGGEENPWTPIDNFKGTFDGKGYTISGVYIDNTDDDSNDFGFFASTSGTIQNLNIANSTINVSVKDKSGEITIGGIASHIKNDGKIMNSSFDGEMNIIASKIQLTGMKVGGICGLYESKTIESCHNAGSIDVTINNVSTSSVTMFDLYISGICNIDIYSSSITSIEDSYNTGSINVKVDGFKATGNVIYSLGVGGITHGPKCNITSCYNTGNISASGENNSCILTIGGINGSAVNSVKSCYNIGNIESTVELGDIEDGAIQMIGSISANTNKTTFSNNYYLQQKGVNAVGGNESYNNKDGEIESATSDQFSSGEIAHALREGGYGQSLDANGDYQNDESSPVLLAFSENKGKEVYKLTLNVDETESIIYRNAIESNLLSEEAYKEIMADAAEGQDLVWTTTDNKVFSGNSYKVTKDETLSGELKGVYKITTVVTPEGAGEITNLKATAANGEKVSFSLGINDDYKLLSVTMNEEPLVDENADGIYTFTMPSKDVTITATFEKIETGGDDDDEGGIGTKRYQLFLADQDFYLNDEYDAEGLVLYSLHDKRYTKAGSSFTIWFEKHGEVNEGARVFISNRANGEYKEVKLDEVSGYYQIRNVQSNIYVKLYTEEGFPVANESIEATDARAYAQANKIVVITPEPTDVQIISMAGAVVASAQVAGQQEFANLAEGVYIVRMGNEILKLQVRN